MLASFRDLTGNISIHHNLFRQQPRAAPDLGQRREDAARRDCRFPR